MHLLTYHLCLICAASNLLAKVKYIISLTMLIVLLLILKHNKCQEKQYVSRKPLQQCCWFVVVVVAAVDISPRGLAPQRDAARPCFFVAAPPAAWPGPGLVSLLGAGGVAGLGPAAAAAVGALVKPVPASHTSRGLQFRHRYWSKQYLEQGTTDAFS